MLYMEAIEGVRGRDGGAPKLESVQENFENRECKIALFNHIQICGVEIFPLTKKGQGKSENFFKSLLLCLRKSKNLARKSYGFIYSKKRLNIPIGKKTTVP